MTTVPTTPTSATTSAEPSPAAEVFAFLGKGIVKGFKCSLHTAREAVWVIRTLPHLVFALGALILAALWLGEWWQATGPSLGLAGLLTYPVTSPTRWGRVTDDALAHEFKRSWTQAATAAGITTRNPHHHNDGAESDPPPPPVVVPDLMKCRAKYGVITARLRLHSGLTFEAVEAALPALGIEVGAYSVDLLPHPPSHAVLTVTCRDNLTVTSTPPTHTATPGVGAGEVLVTAAPPLTASGRIPKVNLGRLTTGEPWEVDPAVHTFVAGATGAGKASVEWSLITALTPWVDSGHVRLVGIDLKAGMELSWASNLFAALATTPADAVRLLEHLAEEMHGHAASMAGTFRAHTPTPDSPLTVVVIDELAVLTAFNTDSKLKTRAHQALGALLALGRAPGYAVWAFAQDPRKETCTHRNLFPRAIALRLDTASEVGMVLGEHHTDKAPAHRITITEPGIGYTVDDTGLVHRIRAHFVPDHRLEELNQKHCTPHHITTDPTGVTWHTPHQPPTGELLPPTSPTTHNDTGTTPQTTHKTDPDAQEAHDNVTALHPPTTRTQTQRGPRAPRNPRAPRAPRTPRAPRQPRRPRDSA